jgi:vancomycin resistance protein YoaR
MSSRPRTRIIVPVVAVIAVIAVVIGAWAIDSSRQSGRTARGLTVAGRPIGGLTETELRAATDDLATDYDSAWVSIATPAGDLDTTAAAVGLDLDEEAIVQAALAVDRDDSPVARPFSWLRSFVTGRAVPLSFDVDPAVLTAGIAELDAANRVAPTEPTIATTGGAVTVVAGIDGAAIDPAALASSLEAAAEEGSTPIRVQADPTPTEPRFSDTDAQAVADQATEATATPLALEVGGKSATIVSETLRSWVTAVPGPTALELQADQAKIVADLPTLVTGLGVAPVPASFNVVPDGDNPFGKVEIVDGQLGVECCAPDSAERIATALVSGQHTATLDLWPIGPVHDKKWAEGLGIVQPVGSFTTPHPAGEPRVQNIHRIADVTRGMIIEPGEVWSLNDRVGKRTIEAGYVEAPVIYDDVYTSDVGGGVSQFATTIFNAAFFSGLDFDEYQSHTRVIDRYPTGREATVSFPSPDLKIRNDTPYGILIWTSYTETSVTVTFYSTPWVAGEQTGQRTEPKGPCTRYVTERTRTWVDGRSEVDTVVGIYAPGDGISCN